MEAGEMRAKREQFFEGEGPTLAPSPALVDYHKRSIASKKEPSTASDMLNRIDPRLRRLAMRAYRNSYAAAKVVDNFEAFVVGSFGMPKDSTARLGNDNWWRDLLLECPTIARRRDNGKYSAQFYFHATAPTAGFHRLLLHAVCQFHGLNAVPKMERSYAIGGGDQGSVGAARILWVTGNIDSRSTHRLASTICEENEEEAYHCNKADDESAVVVEHVVALGFPDVESTSDCGYVLVDASV
jgi:hypothetical protein